MASQHLLVSCFLAGIACSSLAFTVSDSSRYLKMEHREDRGIEVPTSFKECMEKLDFECIKMKLASNFNKLMSQRSLKLFEGVELERLPEADDVKPEDSIFSPRAIASLSLQDVVINGITELLGKSAVKVNILPGMNARVVRSQKPNGVFDVTLEEDKDNAVEGRRRGSGIGGKKGSYMMILPMMFKLGLVYLGMAALKVLTIKSLLVGKLAIVMNIINGLKNFMSGGYDLGKHGVYGYDNSFQGGNGYGDYKDAAGGSQLAYRRVYHRH